VIASRLWERWCPSRGGRAGGEAREIGKPISRSDTRRTPGPAAGCNRPASRRAEQTVEVVRNHEGGTGLRGWSPRGRRWLATGSGRAAGVSAEGRRAGIRRVTAGCTPTPREEAGSSSRGETRALKGSRDQEGRHASCRKARLRATSSAGKPRTRRARARRNHGRAGRPTTCRAFAGAEGDSRCKSRSSPRPRVSSTSRELPRERQLPRTLTL
jgi:hypothetical protein